MIAEEPPAPDAGPEDGTTDSFEAEFRGMLDELSLEEPTYLLKYALIDGKKMFPLKFMALEDSFFSTPKEPVDYAVTTTEHNVALDNRLTVPNQHARCQVWWELYRARHAQL